MAEPQTIFRFVTVRNPRKLTKPELETGFAKYDPELHAPLIEQVMSARGAGRGAVREIIAAYMASDAYLRTSKELAQASGKLVEWGDWLMRLGGALTVAKLEARLKDQPIECDPEQERRLWDNLLAQTYGGGVSEVREGIINALRALNLSRARAALLKDEAAVRRLATATVVLPAEASLPAAAAAPGEQQPAPNPAEEEQKTLEAAWKEIAAHERAADELKSQLKNELQHARAQRAETAALPRVVAELEAGVLYPDDQAGPADVFVGRLDDARCGQLSEPTRALLEQLQLKDVTIGFAIDKLTESAQRIGARVARDPRGGRSVVQVGGAFWMQTPAHAHASESRPETDARVDLEYHDYYAATSGAARALQAGEKGCRIKPLGIADYRRVEQEICCYEPGEVAHIENVLKGESKERVTRHLRRSEETFTTATEDERTEEKDTQTTDRFELEKQSEKTIQEDIKFDLGVNVQAQYGVVKITADAKFGYAHSSKESDKAASKFAKEVTDRAIERVVKKVREEQIKKLIDEFEETNTHKLEAKDAHTVGLYRWVNKVYKAKVVNYGKRLMLEFLVPEPGAFHLHAMVDEPVEATLGVEKPIDPRSKDVVGAYGVPSPLKDATYVTPANYTLWGAIYGADLTPPPATELTVAKAYHREGMDHTVQFADSKTDLKIPEGYEATEFFSTFGLHSESHNGGANWITVIIGRHSRFTNGAGSFNHALNGEDDFVPIVIMGRTRFYAMTVEVRCLRTDSRLKAWQLETFDKILDAYHARQAAYEVAFAEAKARAGVEIRGTNPLRNREIEQLELKKGAIRLMTQCKPFSSNAMKPHDPQDPCSIPDFDCCEAVRDGSFVQFVEQAFEWKIMTYSLYPYFWGRKCNWKKIYQLDDVDPVFLGFLQAGYARVQVPVRPGYEDAVQRFLIDTIPWNGGSAPGVDSELYLAIANELKEPVGQIDPEVEPWTITVPTTLTVLQCESGCVEGSGLPCPCEEEQPG